MARRQIRPNAENDLQQIWSFIAADNPRAADAMIERLAEAFDMLLAMPLAGRARREFGENFRSFVVDSYVVFYATVPQGIEIVRIMHGRQDIGPADMT
ncbi:MAG: toxin ParE1/3/4 [Bradyrhizobium sp.]|jgi:toxin ParE1/3/4|nr:toxin ParE1/3/4 [Bradyrhizobium sp.]